METCIVCLGELPDRDPPQLDDGDTNPDRVVLTVEDLADVVIARLPCSHMLHNSCLSEWAKRANSCPICRQTFNVVELTTSWTGGVISSYTVEDVVQQADFDETDDLFDDHDPANSIPNCLVCDKDEHDEVLLICDDCESPYHTYCLNLHDVPGGQWFCPPCRSDHILQDIAKQDIPERSAGLPTRAARNQSRRVRTERSASSRDGRWQRAWENVWRGLNSDLDDELSTHQRESAAQRAREDRERRELEEWRRRLDVARRQGGSQRFRETAPWLLHGRQQDQVRHIPVVSMEEQNAWDMMEEAERLHDSAGPSSQSCRKQTTSTSNIILEASSLKQKQPQTLRESQTASSASPELLPAIPVNTSSPARRASLTEPIKPGSIPESLSPSRNRKRPSSRKSSESQDLEVPSPKRAKIDCQIILPTEEAVKESPKAVSERKQKRPMTRRIITKPIIGSVDIGPALRASIAQSANSKDDKLRIIEAHSPEETGSSSLLDSLLENINKPQPETTLDSSLLTHLHQYGATAFDTSVITPAPSPPRMASPTPLFERQRHSSFGAVKSVASPPSRPQSPPPPHLALNQSPVTAAMSSPPTLNTSTKVDIEKMVRAALKPHYHPKGLSKDDFAKINKSVSRKLYNMVSSTNRIKEWERPKWQKIAEEEVQRQVEELSSSGTSD